MNHINVKEKLWLAIHYGSVENELDFVFFEHPPSDKQAGDQLGLETEEDDGEDKDEDMSLDVEGPYAMSDAMLSPDHSIWVFRNTDDFNYIPVVTLKDFPSPEEIASAMGVEALNVEINDKEEGEHLYLLNNNKRVEEFEINGPMMIPEQKRLALEAEHLKCCAATTKTIAKKSESLGL